MKEILSPQSFNIGPESLYRIECAWIGRQHIPNKMFIVEILENICIVNSQVVLDHCHLPILALLFQRNEEVAELIGVVTLVKNFIVNESSLETDRSYQCDRMPSELQHWQFHSWSKPALWHSLPEIEGGLVYIYELLKRLLLHVIHMVPHIIVLVELQFLTLNLILPITIVGSLELDAISVIVVWKRSIRELY